MANSASYSGGGAYYGTLNNCTLSGNCVTKQLSGGIVYAGGGGACYCTLNNCIVYFNTTQYSGQNYDLGSTLNCCCTTPLPAKGTNNITTDPLLASPSHISANSPCRGAGSILFTTGVDIDGEAWANPPSIGCDEYNSGEVTGAVSVVIQASYTNVAPGFIVQFTAQIDGRLSASRWDFGDGTVVSNQPYASHSWAVAGDYVVVLTAFNESYPAGVSATLTMHIAQPVHYVALDSSTPVPPYSSWATAATNIQDAVDAATVPGALVLVSNGVYQTSGRTVNGYALTNRVAVTKPLVLQSVNGPAVTIIQGYRDPVTTNGDSAVRCVYLTNLATLAGFTLTHGATRTNGDVYQEQAGGGVFGFSFAAMVSNCVLTGNSAVRGGGVISNTLYNCIIVSNSSSSGGGGAYHSTLNNCTLSGNTGYGVYYSTLNNCTLAGNYRGASFCTLSNCIVYYNDMGLGYPNYQNCTLNYCCTTPKPGGTGNITNAPLFVDQAGGNLRLQTNAPCINAGNNAYVTTTTDLDGRPRIVGGTVDIGAYEFQGAGMGEFIGWLQQYGLPTDGSADYLDADGDGMNNWQEWLCETDPTNALSVLQMLAPSGDVTGVTVTWQSVTDRTYFLERATNLRAQPPFSTLATNLTGQPVTTSYADTNAVGPGPFFYRVGVQQ